MKKIISIITLILVTFANSFVLAREEESNDVARIGSNYYATLSEAISSAGTGDTITFIRGAKLSEKLSVPKGKKIIFDLNKKTLELADISDNYALVVGGTLTITGNGRIDMPGLYGIGVQPSGNLTIENGTFNQTTGDYLIGNWGATTIYDGTFNANYSAVNGFAGNVTIEYGKFTGNEWPLVVGNVLVEGGIYNKDVSNYLSSDSVILTVKVEQDDINKFVVAIIPKGSEIDKEKFKEALISLSDTLIPTGYIIVDFYTDKNLTTEFDFNNSIDEDTTIYLKLKNTVEPLPVTSDINLIFIVETTLIGIVGIVIILRKKFLNNCL